MSVQDKHAQDKPCRMLGVHETIDTTIFRRLRPVFLRRDDVQIGHTPELKT